MLAGCSAARQAHPRSPLRTQLRLCVVSRSNHARVRNCSALVPGVVARAAETALVLDGIHFTSRLILWGTTEPHVSTQVTPRNEPQQSKSDGEKAGARVKFTAFLRDMNVSVPTSDLRRIEVLAQDLPCIGGAQLAVDVTLLSTLTRNGELSPGPQRRMAQSCCKLGLTRKISTQNSSTGDVGSWLWLWKREADGAVRAVDFI